MYWVKLKQPNESAEGMAAAAIQFHYTKWMKVEWNGEAGETEWFIQFNRSINSTRWNWIDGGLKWIEHEENEGAQPAHFMNFTSRSWIEMKKWNERQASNEDSTNENQWNSIKVNWMNWRRAKEWSEVGRRPANKPSFHQLQLNSLHSFYFS